MLYTLGGEGRGMGKETDEDITQTNIFSDNQDRFLTPGPLGAFTTIFYK